MSVSKKINQFRRIITRFLTKRISHSKIRPNSDEILNHNVKKILICRPNQRLGNLILITPLLQEIIEIFPNSKIDVLVKGNLPPILFKNYPNINKVIKLPGKPFKFPLKYIKVWISMKRSNYDLVVNVVGNSSSGKLLTKITNADYKIFGDEKYPHECIDFNHIAKNSIYNLRNYLRLQISNTTNNTIPNLDIKLNQLEIINGQNILTDLIKNNNDTICLFTYATGEKCYSESWWLSFYEKLKEKFPKHNIIEVLPKENISQIQFQAPTFYSTNIREIAAVIKNTIVFIGADSGIMHLASSVNTPTIGLFSITDKEMYSPYNRNSIAIDTNSTTETEIIKIINKVIVE